jgi:hypothetical protein
MRLGLPIVFLNRGSQECMHVAVDRAEAHDLSGIVQRQTLQQVPGRALRDERVEVDGSFVQPDDSANIPGCTVNREAGHFALVVDGVATGGHISNSSGELPRGWMPVALVQMNG